MYTPFVETLTAGVVDVEARFDAPVPGSKTSYVYGQMEAATISHGPTARSGLKATRKRPLNVRSRSISVCNCLNKPL